MKLFSEPTLRLTPSWADEKRTQLVRDRHGLIAFRLALWVEGKEVDHMPVVSGQASNQVLLRCTNRVPGCAAPIGEGCYKLGDPDAIQRINWASGRPGDYSASFKAGLGPIWVGIHPAPGYPCSTSDFGLHADWNADGGYPGTLGCTGIPTPAKSLTRLKQLASWFAEHSPADYVVDHGFGTVPHPQAKVDGRPVAVEVLHRDKLFFNDGRLTVYRNGDPAKTLKARIEVDSGVLGVTINGVQFPPDQIEFVRLEVAYKAK